MKTLLIALVLTVGSLSSANPFRLCNPRLAASDARSVAQQAAVFRAAIQDKVNFVGLTYLTNRLIDDSNRLAYQADFANHCIGLRRLYQEVALTKYDLENDFYRILNNVNGPRPGLVQKMQSLDYSFQRLTQDIY